MPQHIFYQNWQKNRNLKQECDKITTRTENIADYLRSSTRKQNLLKALLTTAVDYLTRSPFW